MNETDWLAGTDPVAMLDYLVGKASDRKLRLFACACARTCWGLYRWNTPRDAIVLAERLAEGQVNAEELEQMRQQAEASVWNAPMFEQPAYQAAAATLAELAEDAARQACEAVRLQAVREAAESSPLRQDEAAIVAEESARVCQQMGGLVLEIFGNPFRPVTIDPTWLSVDNGSAGTLANWIVEEGRLDELPYLADALLDAGCPAEELLRHLRQRSGHQRGCWALDALLGRV